MNDPFFSVIVPLHNAAEYMRTGLDSIRGQDFQDYELLIVCDRCEDNTVEIAGEYIRPGTNDTLCLVSYGRAGMSRNAALDVARGKWILFMDDDDWYLPGAFQMLAENLETAKDIDILAYGFHWKHFGDVKQSPMKVYPAIWNKAWRRDFIGEERFPDWIHSDDAGFSRKMLPKARIGYLDEVLYYYNFMRPGSVSDRIRNGEYDNNQIPEECRDTAINYERWLKSKEF